MGEEIVPVLALIVGMVIAVTKILTKTISSHRLEVEKIRAEAMVRAEEVRTRNELELEKLMRQNQSGSNANNTNAYNSSSLYNQTEPENEQRSTRERIRD